MSVPRMANAPLSYGAFEMTVGTSFPVPAGERVLAEVAAAGYEGIDLGPPGFLGDVETLAERLGGLALAGGVVPIAFSEEGDFTGLHATLDLFDAAGAPGAHPGPCGARGPRPGPHTGAAGAAGAPPVLCDAGGPDRIANPGAGAALALDDTRWRRLVDGVDHAADIARRRGYTPVFHHHTSTYVEGVPEIERFLADTDVPLLLDSGHLLVAGGDPISALRDWGDRIGAIHIKDARLDVVAAVKAERADTLTAWRRGMFCALGQGDVDLVAFCAALGGYDGWVVVEQDRVLTREDGAFEA